MKLFSNKSNATRAAKKHFGETGYTIIQTENGWAVKATKTPKLGETKTGRISNIKPNVKDIDKKTPTKMAAPKMETKRLSPIAFGFGPGTNADRFGAMVAQAGGTTMTDVINADWNTARRGYYMTVKALEEKGLVKMNHKVRPAVVTVTKKGLAQPKA